MKKALLAIVVAALGFLSPAQAQLTANWSKGGGLGCSSNCSFTGVTNFASGSAAAPSVAGISFGTTGAYWAAGPLWGVAVSGAQVCSFTSTGANSCAIGATTASTGVFTTANATTGLVAGTAAAAPNSVELYAATTSASDPRGVMSAQYSSDTLGARMQLRKGRGSEAIPVVIVTGDTLGRLRFSGYDGANYLQMASIDAVSTGTIASTRVPTYMTLSTATDAAPSVLTESLRLTPTLVTAPGSVLAKRYTPTNQTLTDQATIAWDTSLGSVGTVTLGGNRTFGAPTNLTVGNYILHVIQSSGSNTITWNAVFKWASGIAPTLSTAASAHDIVSCTSDATNLYCGFIGDVK